MRNKLVFSGLGILVLLLLSGCVKNYFDFEDMQTDVQWNPNMAAPVAKAHLKIRDILQDYDYNELFEEDSTHFLYLVYKKRVISTPASDIITLPVQSIGEVYTKQDIDNNGFNTHIIKSWVSYPFSVPNNQLLDSIKLKHMDMTIHVKSTFNHTGILLITFPSLTLNGTPFSTTFNIDSQSGDYDVSVDYSQFDGYTMDLTGLSGTDTNKIFVTYDLLLNDNGNPSVLPGNECNIDINFQNMHYYSIYGYLGRDTAELNRDTIHLEIFDHAFQGSVYFQDPKIHIYVNNSYGLPIRLKFDDLSAYSVVNDNNTTVPFPIDSIDINYPLLSEFGETKNTTITLDTNNFPQLRNLVNGSPKYVFFKVDGILNPDGYTNTNFAIDTSHFYVDMEVELPLWGYADYLVLEDTTETGKDFAKNIERADSLINWVKFRLNVDNGMPAKVGVQVYFDDSLHNVLDSMFTSPQQMEVVPSAQVNANYIVTAPTHKTTDIVYNKARIEKIKNTKYIRFRGYVRTTDFEHAQLVKFYSYYAIDMKLGMQVDATVDSNNY